MGAPIGRYESDLQRYRSDARHKPWLDDDCFDLPFCARVAVDQIEHMIQRQPTSITEMKQILNELGSVFTRVTHAMTRTTKPGEDYCGPMPLSFRLRKGRELLRAGATYFLAEIR